MRTQTGRRGQGKPVGAKRVEARGDAAMDKAIETRVRQDARRDIAEQGADETPARKCQIASDFCSGTLIARYTGAGQSPTDPVFDACGACIVILRRRGLKVKQVPAMTPLRDPS